MKRKVYTDGNGSEAVLIEGLGHYIPINQAVALEKEIDQLKAQIEQLRDAAINICNHIEDNCMNTNGLFSNIEKLQLVVNKTPAQCLAEIRVQDRKNGFIAGYFHCRNHGFQFENELEEASYKYAEKLRKTDKVGE